MPIRIRIFIGINIKIRTRIRIFIRINIENSDQDPDRHQNDADPQHWLKVILSCLGLSRVLPAWNLWTQRFLVSFFLGNKDKSLLLTILFYKHGADSDL
jgi:hypothetical protein